VGKLYLDKDHIYENHTELLDSLNFTVGILILPNMCVIRLKIA